MRSLPLTLGFILALAACIPAAIHSSSPIPTEIVLYSGYSDSSLWRHTILLGAAQKCISMRCLLSKTVSIRWNLQDNAYVVFFEKVGCKGKSFMYPRGDQGDEIIPVPTKYRVAQSMMVWESGTYATRGIVDLCDEL